MNNAKLLDYNYPQGYIKLKELHLIDFEYWYFIPDNQFEKRFMGMKERFPNRKYIPFARRDDCDDIACFELGKGETVFIIHDYASDGYEERKRYNDIWDWVRDAIDELINENRILSGYSDEIIT